MKKIFFCFCLVLLITSSNSAAKDTKPAKDVTVDVLAKSDSSWNGSLLPAYTEAQPEITILKIKIMPGVTLPMHYHPVINAGVLLEGELTVITEDNKTLEMKAGDALIEVVNKWHYGKNEGKVPAVIIVFYAGNKDMPVTVKK